MTRSPHTIYLCSLLLARRFAFHPAVVWSAANDFEFTIQIQGEEPKACERSARVARWKRHLRLFDLLRVAGAHGRRVLHSVGWRAETASRGWYGGKADGEEVRAQTADEPFDEGLEYSGGCEGVA